MNRRTVIVSLLALGLMVWFLRDANLGAIWVQVRQVRGELLVVSLATMAFSFVARTIRWRYLLDPIGPTQFRTVFRTTVIGFGALGLLPVRVGDLVRPYLLARQARLPASSTLATVVMERVLDLAAVLALLALYVWGFGVDRDLPGPLMRSIEVSATAAAVLSTTALVIMWVLATHPERVGVLASAAARVLPGRLSGRVGHVASRFSSGFAAAREPRALVMAMVWSFPVWLAISAQVWTVTIAFGIDIPFAGTFLLQSLLVIGVAMPTPGGVGSFHEAYRIGVTTFFNASNDRAIAAAIVAHAISFVPPVLVGIAFMAQDGLSVGGLKDLASTARTREGSEKS
jgi:uncharacterized protein (TIRG00374 family)